MSIIFFTIMIILLALLNGYFANNLKAMVIKDVAEYKEAKAKWHIVMNLIIITLISCLVISEEVLIKQVEIGLLGLSIHFFLYDNIINLIRGLGIIDFIGTCEGDWDWDCILLKIDSKFKLNYIRIIFLLIAIILYARF